MGSLLSQKMMVHLLLFRIAQSYSIQMGNHHAPFALADPLLKAGAAFEAMLLDASPFIDLEALRQPRQVWLAAAP